jgi:AbiV family abortive infection protein
MAKRSLPTSIPPGVLLKLGRAAISNSLSLAEDARILAEHKRWTRATALMVTAHEEGGKGFYAIMLGLAAMVEKKGKKTSIEVLLKSHPEKQALGVVLQAAAALFARSPLGVRSESRSSRCRISWMCRSRG